MNGVTGAAVMVVPQIISHQQKKSMRRQNHKFLVVSDKAELRGIPEGVLVGLISKSGCESTEKSSNYLSIRIAYSLNFSVFAVDARCGDVNFHKGAPRRGLGWAVFEAASATDPAGRRTVHFPTTIPFFSKPTLRMTPIYVISTSQGDANIMHLELVVIECSAQGDGIAINSGVKTLESRLDMTKYARKTSNYEN